MKRLIIIMALLSAMVVGQVEMAKAEMPAFFNDINWILEEYGEKVDGGRMAVGVWTDQDTNLKYVLIAMDTGNRIGAAFGDYVINPDGTDAIANAAIVYYDREEKGCFMMDLTCGYIMPMTDLDASIWMLDWLARWETSKK